MGLLAAVLAAGVGGHAADVVGEPASGLASWGLYFYNLCAVIGKVGANNGACGVNGEVEDLDAFEHFHKLLPP